MANAMFNGRCAVQLTVTVVGVEEGSRYQPLALASTSVGAPSDPSPVDAVQPGLYPSPTTNQHPVGHAGTSTTRLRVDSVTSIGVTNPDAASGSPSVNCTWSTWRPVVAVSFAISSCRPASRRAIGSQGMAATG